MSTSRAPLLPRLRRHPLLRLLVVLVLLAKVASASVCMADTRVASVDPSPTLAGIELALASAPSALPAGDGCLLGEGACHCACAETLPIPVVVDTRVTTNAPVTLARFLTPLIAPKSLDSALRPPIA